MSLALRRALLVESSGLRYPYPRPTEPGQTIEVAPGLHWLRMPLPWALDHVNVWLLRDCDGWIAIDTGQGSERTCALWQQIFDTTLAGLPIKAVIATHFHPDHIGLAGWLTRRFGASLWMTASEYLTALAVRENSGHYANDAVNAMFHRHGADDARLRRLPNRNQGYSADVVELPAVYRRIRDGDQIDIGGKVWRVIVGYGHAPEHASLYCAANDALIAGDMVLPRISPNIGVWPTEEEEGDPLGLFLESLARFAELPRKTLVLPSHGEVFLGLHARLHQLEEHHRERLAELLVFCAKPRTAAESLPVLFKRELDDQQWFFAMGEAIAHLNYLMAQKKLRREQGEDGIRRFRRV